MHLGTSNVVLMRVSHGEFPIAPPADPASTQTQVGRSPLCRHSSASFLRLGRQPVEFRCRVCAIRRSQLAQQVLHMSLDRAGRDPQPGGDILVRGAPGKVAEHLDLTSGQLTERTVGHEHVRNRARLQHAWFLLICRLVRPLDCAVRQLVDAADVPLELVLQHVELLLITSSFECEPHPFREQTEQVAIESIEQVGLRVPVGVQQSHDRSVSHDGCCGVIAGVRQRDQITMDAWLALRIPDQDRPPTPNRLGLWLLAADTSRYSVTDLDQCLGERIVAVGECRPCRPARTTEAGQQGTAETDISQLSGYLTTQGRDR